MNNFNRYVSRVKSLLKGNMFFFKDNKKLIKVAAAVMIIVVALVFFAEKGEKDTIKVPKDTITSSESKEKENKAEEKKDKKEILVDISGAVVEPGVYTVNEGSRLYDVIRLAGGLHDNADIDAINQAEEVSDGQKIYIPEVGEESSYADTASGSSPLSLNKKININTAGPEELQTISGIGPSTAQKIIEYRSVNGRFASIDEIKNVSGIGEKTFEKLKDYITV